jgi:antitoxin component YwqK of YwqJK toxin-antitoxin module
MTPLKKLSYFVATLFLAILFQQGMAQTDDEFFMRDDTVVDFIGITKYDAFCPVLEGDSVRFCGKAPCTGWVKEYYPGTQQLIHEGSYDYGRITNTFTNYFLSGKVERTFVKKPNGEYYSLDVFDSLNNPTTKIEYYRTIVIKRKDYYRGGILELDEEYDKKGKYFVLQKYFYPDGKLFSELLLVDQRKNSYSYKEYSKNGKLKLEGQKIRNPEINDYFNQGKWVYYDESGKIIKEEIYKKGTLVD